MKKEEVPQDDENMLEGKFKKVFYALDEQGNYVKVPSAGWEPENTALKQAWEVIEEKIAEARQRMQSGEISPIGYYLEKCMFDIPLLAAHVGKFQWQVKRHLKPEVFAKLSPRMLEKYAKAFDISVGALKNPTNE